jgi:glycosyltransferase involved in cell wall biosynthesis
MPQVPPPQNRDSEELRLIFLAFMHRQKGPLILLEALRLLAQENSTKVTCDFCEGHSGIIIESMQAGVPVISTQHRAIPELITHSENGLPVSVRDSHALAETIERIALDRPYERANGRGELSQGIGVPADVVVPQMLEIMFPE